VKEQNQNALEIKKLAKKIGNDSLLIINKCQQSCGKNDLWQSAVDINYNARKIYSAIDKVN
jgi:hypothetical protein